MQSVLRRQLLALINPSGFTIQALYPITTFYIRITRFGCKNCGNYCIEPECNDRQNNMDQTEILNFTHPIFPTVRASNLAYAHFVHIKPTAPACLSRTHGVPDAPVRRPLRPPRRQSAGRRRDPDPASMHISSRRDSTPPYR